jgi:hypothetical protein
MTKGAFAAFAGVLGLQGGMGRPRRPRAGGSRAIGGTPAKSPEIEPDPPGVFRVGTLVCLSDASQKTVRHTG